MFPKNQTTQLIGSRPSSALHILFSDDSDDSNDSQDDTVVPFISLVTRSQAVLPPASFLCTIANEYLRNCHNMSLVLWLMNGTVTLSMDFQECDAPFQLFKDCYNPYSTNKYENYFQVWPKQTKLAQDDGASFEISIFPQLFQVTKLDHLRTHELLFQYTQQFARIIDIYKMRAVPQNATYFRSNISMLLQSYVYDMMYDVSTKWRTWNRIVGNRLEFQPFSLLIARFWNSYMFLRFDESLPKFASTLNSDPNCTDLAQSNTRVPISGRQQLKYGIWADSSNGIILFINRLSNGGKEAIPTHGINLMSTNTEQNVSKMLLFVNLCLMECISWQLRDEVETSSYIKRSY